MGRTSRRSSWRDLAGSLSVEVSGRPWPESLTSGQGKIRKTSDRSGHPLLPGAAASRRVRDRSVSRPSPCALARDYRPLYPGMRERSTAKRRRSRRWFGSGRFGALRYIHGYEFRGGVCCRAWAAGDARGVAAPSAHATRCLVSERWRDRVEAMLRLRSCCDRGRLPCFALWSFLGNWVTTPIGSSTVSLCHVLGRMGVGRGRAVFDRSQVPPGRPPHPLAH